MYRDKTNVNMKCVIIPVITGATGIVTEGVKKNLEAIQGNLKRWRSLVFQEKYQEEKAYVKRQSNNNNNNNNNNIIVILEKTVKRAYLIVTAIFYSIVTEKL
jgi:hypothetical protein